MINFRLPFSKIEQGMATNAIVSYGAIPISYRLKASPDEDSAVRVTLTETQYEHLLIVDLWLVLLRFRWKGRYKSDVR